MPRRNAFAADAPDPELGQLPGTCAHFVIDRDGTIYQLVPLGIMCRHTVGLNYTAIGIEHVGIGSDFDGVQALPADLKSVADLPNLTAELLRRGYSESDIDKILGGNVLRMMEAVEKR